MEEKKSKLGWFVLIVITILYLCNYILFPHCMKQRIFIGDLKDYCYSDVDMGYKENYFLRAWMEYYWKQIDSVFTLTTIDYHDAKRVYLTVDEEYIHGGWEIEDGYIFHEFDVYSVKASALELYPVCFGQKKLCEYKNQQEFEQALRSVGIDPQLMIEKIEDINKQYRQALVQLTINEYHKTMKEWCGRLVVISLVWGFCLLVVLVKKIDKKLIEKEQAKAMGPYLENERDGYVSRTIQNKN